MTILHDNLYTKRAVSALRGRNRYLSRAMWMKWVSLWPNRKRPQKNHEMMRRNLNLTTCWAMPLAILARSNRLLKRRLRRHPLPKSRRSHQCLRNRNPQDQPAPQADRLQDHPALHRLAHHPGLQVDHHPDLQVAHHPGPQADHQVLHRLDRPRALPNPKHLPNRPKKRPHHLHQKGR
jgi:hypothetical protein